MKVFIEVTESPNIIKLKSNEVLVNGSYEFSKNDTSEEIPLVNTLLQFPFINKVYITANFIALEKVKDIDWQDVIDEIKNLVNDYLEVNSSLIIEKKKLPFTLYAEMTPNPEVLKFVSNKMLIDGIIEIKHKDETNQVPLASYLFGFDYVKEVFIYQNYVSITKTEQANWNEITNEIRVNILDFLQSGKAITHVQNFSNQTSNLKSDKIYTETEQKIKDILEEYVNPAVANDGGNIQLVEYKPESKTAVMLLRGACSGCPSSTMTLKNGIETMLKNFLPNEIEAVESLNE